MRMGAQVPFYYKIIEDMAPKENPTDNYFLFANDDNFQLASGDQFVFSGP